MSALAAPPAPPAPPVERAAPKTVRPQVARLLRDKITPVIFAVTALKKKLYRWQADIMMDFASGEPTTAVTPNGAGKTSVCIATLALWVLSEWPGATVVITSATYRAVKDQIFAALHSEPIRPTSWAFNDTEITTPQGGRILGFSTDRGGRFEGFHEHPDRPLAIILDEAKSIRDDIFVAADRCQPTFLLYISSPGGPFGRFADSFKNARFRQHRIGIEDCPHIDAAFIAAMAEQYGEDSAIYRSMIRGEFSDESDQGKVVPFAAYTHAQANPPPARDGIDQVFCDFAETSDECVIARRQGNVLSVVDAWKPDGDTARIAARFEERLRPLAEAGAMLRGDADGTGHGYITTLKLRGIPITGVKNNDKPRDPHYYNLAAEMWWNFAKQVKACAYVLPADDVLTRQLCSREEVWVLIEGKKRYGREDGKLQLQPKKRSGMGSPDRADALIGAAYDYPELGPTDYLRHGQNPRYPDALPSRSEILESTEAAEQYAGFYAGG